MRNISFHSPHGLSATVQADVRTLIRIGRSDGRPGDISVEHHGDGTIDVKIAVDTLSSRHAELYVLSDSVAVKDLNSTNGTWLPIAPGEDRSCNGRIQLGTEVTVDVDGDGLGVPEEAPVKTTEDLVAYLQDKLRSVDCRVEIAKGLRDKRESHQTLLPLVHAAGPLVVAWPRGTVDLAKEIWLRAVVNGFNLRNQSSADNWRFTALSPERRRTLHLARRAAPFEDPILLLGPSGCGKGVLAQDIHEHSLRAGRPFVPVNCTAVPEEIFEREFFGHVRGAFTGAVASTPGYIQAADGGTLFLDEIGDMPLHLQGKLLTFLDKKEFTPLGTAKSQFANVRIIAATNKDIVAMLGMKFREDLYYRLAPIEISLAAPQAADIRGAVLQLAREVAARNRVALLEEEVEQIAYLAATRTYPGHFRELQSLLIRYLLVRENGQTIEQTWRAALAITDARVPLDGLKIDAPIPGERRDAFVRHIENYARLQLARRASGATELACQTQQTTAAIYAWLKRTGLKPEDIGDTQTIREAIDAEIEALQPYLPLMHDLLLNQGKEQ